ncbi:MAG: acetyltransferase [Planctomycetes bacterium]|nr:acetyltransferase [Planctomycetota bacterium]
MKVILFGTGPLAEVLHACLSETGVHEPVAFTVDRAFAKGDSFLGLPLVPFEEAAARFPPGEFGMVIAAGYGGVNRLRREKHRAAKALGYPLPSFVHPSTPLSRTVAIGEGTVVLEGNQLQPHCRLGDGVFLWSGNVVGHHAVVGDHAFLTSHVVVGGRTVVGERCFLGPNATVRDGIVLGEGCVLGPGTLLMADAAPGGVYAAEPTPRSRVPSDRLRGL